MATLTIPKSRKKSIRLTFTAVSLAVLASCGSTGRTALTPGVEAQSSTATTPSAATAPSPAPTVGTPAPTTAQTPAPEITATVATEPVATVPVVTAAVTPETAPLPTPPAPTPPPVPASPTSADPIAAVDASGDAVLVGRDGATTVLYEGTDPDDPLPEEGTWEHTAGVAVTDDLGIRIVGTCCEPVPGWLIVSSGTNPPIEVGNFGHAPVISPDQVQVAAITVDAVYVSRLDLTGLHEISIETAGAAVLDIEWIDDVNIVVLVSSSTEAALYRYQVTDEGLVATAVVSIPVASALAGVDQGVVYAMGDTTALTAYAIDTFAPLPERDVVLAGVPLSASMHDGELRWIDQERNLHIGDTILPGQYVWVA
jgi:hypothetical protein